MTDLPQQGTAIWRSMLFVPAHVQKFIASAHTRGADALILDLEDSVPAEHKAVARRDLQASVRTVSSGGASVIVRVNAEYPLPEADLDAAVVAGVAALMIPKVESAALLQILDARITQLEAQRGLPRGQLRLIAQIEHVRTLPRLDDIATATPRLLGMILGSEDFSVSAGMEPTPEALYGPNQQLLFACRRAGILPFGFPGSISVFRDLVAFRTLIDRAREMGFVGAYAIHPDQVSVMNQAFAPSAEAVAQARELLATAEQALAEGRGAFEFRGRMVDPPVVARAQETLRRAR